ncbi:hypothetical protein ACW5XW_15575 [Aeromonas piscicola]|uniref:hypothetical protein n=1 Tax=Aeromonas piscicola TaxID=600645 RepID=UPI0012E02860|nr:hypothetical protein [Aeromonas piscicola]
MSSKISVTHIVKSHYKTLFSSSSIETKVADATIFFVLPLAMSSLAMWAGLVADNDLVSLCVNFGSIFTALLLSVLVLVYDQENKIIDKIREANSKFSAEGNGASILPENILSQRLRSPRDDNKRVLMKELYANIAYCIVISVLLVAISAINLGIITIAKDAIFNAGGVNKLIFTPLMVFLSLHLLVTIVMVVKRLYSLLLSNED